MFISSKEINTEFKIKTMEANQTVLINDLRNVDKLCRVCLTESKKMISLNSEIQDKLEPHISSISNVLYRVTLYHVQFNESYPSLICPMCLGILNISYKFKLQFENSQKMLDEYFGDSLNLYNSHIELIQEEPEEEKAPVELIAKGSKYDLSNVFVVENTEEERPNFNAFLKNLGSEVSATYVNQNTKAEKEIKLVEPVSLISLNKINQVQVVDNVEIVFQDFSNTEIENLKSHKLLPTRVILPKQKVHNDSGSFICEICGLLSKTRSSHYHHMVTHKEKRYKCDFCCKKYYNSSNLRKHVTAVHKNERPHLCTVCGKSFNYANAYEYHMRIHKNERKYKCTYCDKTFIMQCSLSRHLRTHTGQRPYQCKYCERAFRSNGELACHTMIHTGYRPFHCKYCNKGFTKAHNLKLHLLQHPGSHACYICKKTFAEIDCLKVHMKVHKGVL